MELENLYQRAMISCRRTNSEDKDFQALVKELDKELGVIDGKDHAFYDQYNKIDGIKYAIVLYDNSVPVGCGAIKEFTCEQVEVKRMYVPKERRNKGLATTVLKELEKWAKELGYPKCVMETGKRQPDAVQLYTKNGYKVIANYGPYVGVENSVCFEKAL